MEYDNNEFESEESIESMDSEGINESVDETLEESGEEESTEESEGETETSEASGETIAEVRVLNFPQEYWNEPIEDLSLTTVLLIFIILILGIMHVGGFKYDV